MTGPEIVAVFERERSAAAKKIIDETKAAGKFKVPRPDQIRFTYAGYKPKKPTSGRIYEAESKLVEVMRAFPDFAPERLVRAVAAHTFLEPIVIARLWTNARARFEGSKT